MTKSNYSKASAEKTVRDIRRATRHDGITDDAERRPGFRHGARHLRDPALGRTVSNAIGEGAKRLQRGDVDDVAPTFAFHSRNTMPRQKERCRLIDIQCLLPAVFADFIIGFAQVDTGALINISGSPNAFEASATTS